METKNTSKCGYGREIEDRIYCKSTKSTEPLQPHAVQLPLCYLGRDSAQP